MDARNDMKQRILKVFETVFGDNAENIYFNGLREEGCSVIVLGYVWNKQIDELLQVLNQDMADKLEQPLGEWRVRRAYPGTIVNKEVPEDVREDCYEVRLIYNGYYGH